MDSTISRPSPITDSQARIRTHLHPFGDSREHMGWILYPRVRAVRRRVYRSTPLSQQAAAAMEIQPAQSTGETPDKACRPQTDAGQAIANADQSRKG